MLVELNQTSALLSILVGFYISVFKFEDTATAISFLILTIGVMSLLTLIVTTFIRIWS